MTERKGMWGSGPEEGGLRNRKPLQQSLSPWASLDLQWAYEAVKATNSERERERDVNQTGRFFSFFHSPLVSSNAAVVVVHLAAFVVVVVVIMMRRPWRAPASVANATSTARRRGHWIFSPYVVVVYLWARCRNISRNIWCCCCWYCKLTSALYLKLWHFHETVVNTPRFWVFSIIQL